MLKFFSRLEKTRNAVILVFGIVLVLSMILVGASVLDFRGGSVVSARSTEPVAKVGSGAVTVGDLVLQKENMARFSGRAPASSFLLDGLIRQRIIAQEAERLGFTASDQEVAAEIREQYRSTDGTPFDIKVYEQNVTEQFGSVKAYEDMVREEIAARKLEAFITAGVTASEAEVLEKFQKNNSKFDLSYVALSVPDLAQSIKPTDEELKNYFEANKANYAIRDPQKKIRYIFVNTSKIGEKLQISEADLKAEYDKLPEERKQAGIQGQQIVLRIAKPEFEGDVLAKASEIAANARKDGGKISEQAFAELAQGHSEDPNTARNGGKIPGLVRENPNNPGDPYQRLLSMQEGEVTEPIKYGERYYILRRGASVPKTFEDAKKEIEVSLRNRRAYAVAAELAQKITEDLKQTKDVQATAQKFAAEANMNVKDMIRETDYVKPGDEVPNVGISPQFEEGIAGLNNPNDVGEKIPIKDGFGIPLLVDKRDPRDATFEEVKDKVAEAVKLDKARAEIEKIANEIASGSANAAALAAIAQSKGVKAQDAKNFILGSPLGSGPSAGTTEELENAIFALKPGEVTKTPIRIGENWYIVGVNSREEASMEEFNKQRDQLMQAALMQKRAQVFTDYISSVRRRMEADGKIRIYKEALNKVDNLDADAGI
jgi:PPIC-type PPIASE domain.